MKYKKVKVVAFIFIFTLSLITSIIIYLSASSFCKTTKIFNLLFDFGISQIEDCSVFMRQNNQFVTDT